MVDESCIMAIVAFHISIRRIITMTIPLRTVFPTCGMHVDDHLYLHNRFNDSLTVKDFGAKGDGITDDTVVLQTVFDLVIAAGGGCIYFPAGIYRTTAPLTMTKNITDNNFNVTIKGASRSTSIIYNSGVGHTFDINAGAEVDCQNGELVFRDLTIRGNAASGDGLHLTHVHYWGMENCIVENHAGYGLWVHYGYVMTLDKCRIEYNGGTTLSGVYIESATDHVRITETDMMRNGRYNLYVYGCLALSISGSSFERASTNEIIVLGYNGAEITGCYLESRVGGASRGIFVGNGYGMKISSNYFGNAGLVPVSACIEVGNGAESVTIENNLFNAYTYGIDIQAAVRELHIGKNSVFGGAILLNNGVMQSEVFIEQNHAGGNDYQTIPTIGYSPPIGEPAFFKLWRLHYPITGVHDSVGDVVWNITPANGDPMYWVCTTAGAPGVWSPVFVGAGAIPTTGTGTIGNVVWNSTPISGQPMGWMCTHSGTFSVATDNTGDTDGATAVITGMTDTSDFAIGDQVDVSAGFPTTGPYRIIAKTITSITISVLSNAVVNNITVDTSDPVWTAMANLA